jgi:hypothetical protein
MDSKWDRSNVLALAKEDCTQCRGFGLRERAATGRKHPAIVYSGRYFAPATRAFDIAASGEKHVSHARLEQVNGKEHRHTWGMKDEEFMADFCLVAKRYLTPLEHRIFRFHYLLGADWKLCCRQMKMDRGDFFHTVYRLQQKLGRIFKELKAVSTLSPRRVFRWIGQNVVDRNRPKLFEMSPKLLRRYRLIPPLRKVA